MRSTDLWIWLGVGLFHPSLIAELCQNLSLTAGFGDVELKSCAKRPLGQWHGLTGFGAH